MGRVIVLALLLVIVSAGCDTAIFGVGSPIPGGPAEPLTADEVRSIVTGAVRSLNGDALVVAVTDREGNILGLFRKNGASEMVMAALAGRQREVNANDLAVSLARTGAFFSNDQAPLSSRTVRFISREHFPPTFAANGAVTGVKNTPSGALWNIEGTNRGCFLTDDYIPGQEIARPRSVDGSASGLGVATIPGGVPLFKSGKVVGGVGVCGVAPDLAEFAAVSGSAGFGPVVAAPGVIFLDGVRLPFVEQTRRPFGFTTDEFEALSEVGSFVSIPSLSDPSASVADVQGSIRDRVPEGWLVEPRDGTFLSASQVRTIINRCVARANRTRAAIRLPLQERTKMVMAVADVDGEVLGLYRMPDATVFSIDVAVTKARNVVYFSGFERSPFELPNVPMGTAVTNRTLRFGSQPFFPAGINGTAPGPFWGLLNLNYEAPCTQGLQATNPNQSGIVFFPGSAPLYRFGTRLVGGLGVSGDGVEQDDYVTAGGLVGFEADGSIRADRLILRGVPLPYLKFPRAPEE
jgi:uncharacterized protein GlcG (DUF336 family)